MAKEPKVDGEPEEDEGYIPWDERPPVFAEKLRLLFDAIHPEVADVTTQAVWAAGELLDMGGNFNTYITSRDLAKQEGLIFRHFLRTSAEKSPTVSFQPRGICRCCPTVTAVSSLRSPHRL